MTTPTTLASVDDHRRHHPRAYSPRDDRRYHHYMGQPISSSAASFKGCCCCLFLLLILLSLLAVAVALVVVLVLKPKKPQFDLQQVSVQYVLVAPSSPSAATSAFGSDGAGGVQPVAAAGAQPTAAYLSLNITLLFTANNPNKVGIRYDATALDVMYRGVPLGVAAVPAFEQPAQSRRLVETRVFVDHFNVLQGNALDLVRDASLNDRVDLRLTGDVAARILVLGISSPRVRASVDCAIVISPRKQSLTYKQCGVDGLNF
ncbi:uncharacterized protein LOC141843561 [Curcuma longa]|uniref:uncharacterized protein LOC141843561 n=1 Tax=Curcuma longa TaxID=136217 RepID=UPI003D9F7AFE